jgi:hypothetical protein
LGISRVEEEDFGVAALADPQRRLAGDLERVAAAQRLAVHLDRAANDVHVGEAAGLLRERERLARRRQRGVEVRVLVDGDRAVAAVARGDEAQLPRFEASSKRFSSYEA